LKGFGQKTQKMPVALVSHGAPMLALDAAKDADLRRLPRRSNTSCRCS
jgi:hypothetical protein